MKGKNTFFTESLLSKIDAESPLALAYTSQVRASDVGFDFATSHLAFDRLEDEIRELEEALVEYKNGDDSLGHLCDEATDIVFGVINVSRLSNLDMDHIFAGVRLTPEEDSANHVEQLHMDILARFEDFKNAFEIYDGTHNAKMKLAEIATDLMQASIDFVFTHKMNPNDVMRNNVRKFILRCQFIEQGLQKDGKGWGDIDLDEIYARWKQAKAEGL